MKFNPFTPIEVKVLTDGRTIYKTHNGFRFWLTVLNNTTEVDESYYKKSKRLEVKTK